MPVVPTYEVGTEVGTEVGVLLPCGLFLPFLPFIERESNV